MHSNTTYWTSEIISIPVSIFNENNGIKYIYGLYVHSRLKNESGTFCFEDLGEGRKCRILREKNGNVYDIVDTIELPSVRYRIRMIRDFEFLDTIVYSLNSNNLKEKLQEYQTISRNFS